MFSDYLISVHQQPSYIHIEFEVPSQN